MIILYFFFLKKMMDFVSQSNQPKQYEYFSRDAVSDVERRVGLVRLLLCATGHPVLARVYGFPRRRALL